DIYSDSLWIPYTPGSDTLPKPGDIYILYGVTKLTVRDAKNEIVYLDAAKKIPKTRDVHGFSHVGFIVDPTGAERQTADCGQNDGYSGCYQKRIFNEAKGTLNLPKAHSWQPDAGERTLHGWVDLDALFSGWQPYGG